MSYTKRIAIASLSVAVACQPALPQIRSGGPGGTPEDKITLSCSGYSELTENGKTSREPIASYSILIDLNKGMVWDDGDIMFIVGPTIPTTHTSRLISLTGRNT
jgi:hypothetical protein